MKPLHIVIIRFSSLGDVILTSSLPAMLKQAHNERVFITFLTSKGFESMVEGSKWVDQVQSIERAKGIKGMKLAIKMVKDIHESRPIDLLLDLHSTIRSLAIRFFNPSIPRLFVEKRTLERWLLTGLKIDLLSWQYPRMRKKGYGELLLERYIRDTEGIFGLDFNRKVLEQFVGTGGGISSCSSTSEQADLKHFLGENCGPYICLIPTASFPEKRWPLDKFVQLLQLAGANSELAQLKFVILAGPTDSFCEAFNQIEGPIAERIINLQGKTSLKESAQLVKQAQFCVGNDTGLPHIAESVGTPALVILGPTGEQFGFYPHLSQSKAIFKKLWCRPCTTNGKGRCIRSRRYCLQNISAEEVLAEMVQLQKELAC